MKDVFGDTATIYASPAEVTTGEPRLWLTLRNEASTGVEACHEYTPKKARKLARKLLAAADEIDPPAMARTHYEKSVICDGDLAIVAAAVEVEALAGPTGFLRAGDRVFVAEDAGTSGPGEGYVSPDVRGTVAVVTGKTTEECVEVLAPSGLTQWVHPTCLTLVPADAPDVDPAEPRGCCGGGC